MKSRLEIAHVLFMDIVGYSKLLTNEQSEALHELNQIVRDTEVAREAQAAKQLTILPTGDGMALVFTGSVEDPAECALEISQALRAQPSLPVRMGIHSGPVHHVRDANERENVAGVGINIAQRVMDCGDAGHILVTKRVADDLAQHRRWQPYLHELGDVEVKHGTVVSLVNLYAETIGNPAPPARLAGKARGVVRTNARKGLSPVTRAIFIIVGLIIALTFALAIASIIFTPAIMRSIERSRAATPVPGSPSPPSIGDEIENSINKKVRDTLQEKLPSKSDTPPVRSPPEQPSPAEQPSETASPIPQKASKEGSAITFVTGNIEHNGRRVVGVNRKLVWAGASDVHTIEVTNVWQRALQFNRPHPIAVARVSDRDVKADVRRAAPGVPLLDSGAQGAMAGAVITACQIGRVHITAVPG